MNNTHVNTLVISYTSCDFPTGTASLSGELQTGWDELLWAALTVGRPSTAHVLAHGRASYHEALFRLSLVRMALGEQPGDTSLQRTDAFRSLDPTEKGAVTYFLGLAVCKLFASSLLRTPWLLHLDVFRSQLSAEVRHGRSRPDLVGQDDKGEWHAFECKGRSSVPSTGARRRAKTQAQRLVRVDSKDCSLHIGAISYFRQDALEFHWRDPDPEDATKPGPIEVYLPENAWINYYAPALALALARQSDVRAAADIEVEVHEEVLELLRAGKWDAARLQAREIRPKLRSAGYCDDGLKVVAGQSWREERSN